MVEQRDQDTRPETNATFVTFTNGLAVKNAEALRAWIQEREVKRSQIISITMNETEIEEGDQMLTVFYRERPIRSGELPFEDLNFNAFNQFHSWKKLLTEADSFKSGRDVISLSQSAKNIGGSRNQHMWHARGSNAAGTPYFKLISRDDGNWSELANEARDWLNKFVPPHMLISTSLYQDVHDPESDSKKINVCIAHAAGSNPQDLSLNEEATAIRGNDSMYDLNLISGSGEWEDAFKQAEIKINEAGGQEGHCVASANDSSNDGFVIMVLSWKSIVEGNLKETVRPASCMENCTIF